MSDIEYLDRTFHIYKPVDCTWCGINDDERNNFVCKLMILSAEEKAVSFDLWLSTEYYINYLTIGCI